MRGLLVAVILVGLGRGASAEPVKAKPAAKKARPTMVLAAWKPQPAPARRANARTMKTQGMSAYQAGRYDSAVRKFAAALTASETPALVFHAAQAYRLSGDRAAALAHYERYLELAPDGPAAPLCRTQVERLRDSLP